MASAAVVLLQNGGAKIIGALSTATVTQPDIEACGGTVVHIVDTVLVPCAPSAGENATDNPLSSFAWCPVMD